MGEEMFKVMKDYLPAWLITLTLLLMIGLFLFKGFREALANLNVKKFFKGKKNKVEDLNSHQFFVFIEYMEKYKIDRMSFGDEGRTRIFRDYFKLRCKKFNENTKALLNENVLELEPVEVKIKIFDTLFTSISQTNKTMLDECSNDEERFVVNYVVEKFASHADSSIEAFKEVIETVFDSSLSYNSNMDHLNAMLNVFLFVFVATFAESEKVLFKVNGQVSGKHYKGIKLQ
jgi:hypothetical protein